MMGIKFLAKRASSSGSGAAFCKTFGAVSTLQVAILAGISASSIGSPHAPLSIKKPGTARNRHVVGAEPPHEAQDAEPTKFSLQHVCFGPLDAEDEIEQRAELIEKWEWFTTQIAAASLAPKAKEISQLSEDEIIAAIATAKKQLGLVPGASSDEKKLLEHSKTFMMANGFELFGVTNAGLPLFGLGATRVLDKKLGSHWYLQCCADHVNSLCPCDEDLTDEHKLLKHWASLGMRLIDFRIEIDFGTEDASAAEWEYAKLTADWRKYWISNIAKWDSAWKKVLEARESGPLSSDKQSARRFLGIYLVDFMDIHGYEADAWTPQGGIDHVFIKRLTTSTRPSEDKSRSSLDKDTGLNVIVNSHKKEALAQ